MRKRQIKCYLYIKCVFRSIENIAAKEENAGDKHFLLFLQCIQKAFFLWNMKSCHCVVKGIDGKYLKTRSQKGGYIDFSHLTALKNIYIYITEMY